MVTGRATGRGFTLIEIMIVVGIIAVVMAMGIPSVVQMTRKDALRQAVSDVVEALGSARALAILDGTPAELDIKATDPITLSVRRAAAAKPLPEEDSLESFFADGAGPEVPDTSPTLPSFVLHPDIAVTMLDVNFKDQMVLATSLDVETARIRFYPNGISDEFTIVLEWEGGIRKISLDSITGQPDVEVLK